MLTGSLETSRLMFSTLYNISNFRNVPPEVYPPKIKKTLHIG
uniref:Uncharacterized protein n=1 Tax=Anguilla anguilla TaxID=7936 RepID=A0A0E9RM74_ANGAN